MRRAALLLVCGFTATACGAGGEGAGTRTSCAAVERRPVLFVHGSGLTPESFGSLIDTLAAGGYRGDWLHAVQLEPAEGANVRAAERYIAPAASRLLTHAQSVARSHPQCRAPARLDVVAHSMGAVSSRWFVGRMSPQSVRVWIGIAPANHGTDRLCGHAGEGNREMCPAFAESGVQAALNGTRRAPRDETPYGAGVDARDSVRVAPTADARIYYYTLRIDPDEWIEPAASAVLDGAGGLEPRGIDAAIRETAPGNFLLPGGIEHDALPRHDQVGATVLSILRAGDAS